MKKFCLSLLCGAAVLALMAGPASARPQYKKVFDEHYGVSDPKTDAQKKLADAVSEAKCNVCHAGKSKKDRNAYGAALGKALPAYDKDAWSSDADKAKAGVVEALKKVGAMKTDGDKTFGELIEAGSLPASAE